MIRHQASPPSLPGESPSRNASERGSTIQRVLIVDDNKSAADLLAVLLGRMGYEAKAVYDGVAAISLVDAYRPDAVLIDIVMPGIDGLNLCRNLRKLLGTRVKLIALSGFADILKKEITHAAGFDSVISKPATAKVLQQVLSDDPDH